MRKTLDILLWPPNVCAHMYVVTHTHVTYTTHYVIKISTYILKFIKLSLGYFLKIILLEFLMLLFYLKLLSTFTNYNILHCLPLERTSL